MAAAVSTPIIPVTQIMVPTGKKPPRKLVMEQIGEFLLDLCHHQIISPDSNWNIEKSRMREEFRKYAKTLRGNAVYFALNHYYKTSDIGTILRRTNFLIDTERGSKFFCINGASIIKYRKQKFDSYDEECRKTKKQNPNETNEKVELIADNLLKEQIIVDESEVDTLIYKGSKSERRNMNFESTDFCCHICENNFETQLELLEHVKDHKAVTNFKYLKTMQEDTPHFKVTYSPCIDSPHFSFKVQPTSDKYIVEKIVIMHNIQTPYIMLAKEEQRYYVDSRLFSLFMEQPIVIIHHELQHEDVRLIEQQHFLRMEYLPEQTFHSIPRSKTIKMINPVPQYFPTDKIRMAMHKKFSVDLLCEISAEFADYFNHALTLTPANIVRALHTLLQVEDMATMHEFSRLVQRNVKLHQHGRKYTLELQVPRRSWKDMSVPIQDEAFKDHFLTPQNDMFIIPESESTKTLKNNFFLDFLLKDGIQRFVLNKKISEIYNGNFECVSNGRLTFTSDDKLSLNKSYMIIFRPARLTLRYQYRALELLANMPEAVVKRFLFPLCSGIRAAAKEAKGAKSLQLQNACIANNPEHLHAVQQIVHGKNNEVPYIIFGPPGTGKTTILVEAVLQLYLTRPDTKILITAGPNSACDEIARRLSKVLAKMNNPRALARIYCRSQAKRRHDESLLKCSNLYDEKHFYPDMDVLHEYRIVVCTLTVVGILCSSTFGKDQNGASVYTHIFLDEGAASSESESLVGLVGAMSAQARLIISGDPKQLGAIITSKRADVLGLGTSLMERLLDRDCYSVNEADEYDRSAQIRLYRNYRSHPEILKLYNELYYENKLVAVGSEADFAFAEKWYRLPNPNFPIIFQSVYGRTDKERFSTSWYNDVEQKMVMDFVKDLMLFGINGVKLNQSDIGIISPYKSQYMKIQRQLMESKFPLIEIGSPEMFRGIEKPIIIVSFVRSTNKTVGDFLSDHKRINVILSRAKSLLILIGNPTFLSQNPTFKHIIKECQLNKTFNSIEPASLRDMPANAKTTDVDITNIIKSAEKLHINSTTFTNGKWKKQKKQKVVKEEKGEKEVKEEKGEKKMKVEKEVKQEKYEKGEK